MLKVIDGKIYVNNIETNDTELIGNAFKDFAEQIGQNAKHSNCSIIFDSDPFYNTKPVFDADEFIDFTKGY